MSKGRSSAAAVSSSFTGRAGSKQATARSAKAVAAKSPIDDTEEPTRRDDVEVHRVDLDHLNLYDREQFLHRICGATLLPEAKYPAYEHNP